MDRVSQQRSCPQQGTFSCHPFCHSGSDKLNSLSLTAEGDSLLPVCASSFCSQPVSKLSPLVHISWPESTTRPLSPTEASFVLKAIFCQLPQRAKKKLNPGGCHQRLKGVEAELLFSDHATTDAFSFYLMAPGSPDWFLLLVATDFSYTKLVAGPLTSRTVPSLIHSMADWFSGPKTKVKFFYFLYLACLSALIYKMEITTRLLVNPFWDYTVHVKH